MNNRIFGQKISCIVFTLVLFVFLPLKGEEWSAAKLFNGPGESDFFQTCFLKIKSTVYEDLHTAMMTLPTYVGAGTSIQGSDVTSISISQPSGTSIGDFLLAIISTDGTTSLAAPAGWTTLNQGQSTSSASTLSIFYRTADSAGSSSHNFTWSGGQNALGAILAYSGVDTSNPFDNFNAGSDISTGTSNNPTSPSKTTSEANTAIIYAYSADADYGNNTPYEPSGTTGVFGDRSGSTGSVSVSIGIARKDQASAGATGTGAFDMRNSNSEEWRAATLALRGVSSGGSNCTGNGTVISNVGVPNAANATGTPDGSYAELYQNGDEVILDLGEALSATTTVTVTYRRISASTPVWTIETSASANSGFSAVAESPFSITTGQNVVSTFTVTVPSGNQYLRFISNGIDADLDGITFTCPPTGCGPTAVSVVANQVTCNGTPPTATANSDASIVLNTATDGDRYLIVAGTDFGTQTAADATTFTQGDLPLTLLSNLANPNGSQTYTIRIFNGNDDNCSTEVTVTLNERDCNPTCDCKEYIYVNDEQEDLTHKFEINPTTGAITEIFSTGTTPWATGISDPHGLAQDINGGIYIGNRSGADTDFGNAGNIRKFSCDGVEDNTTNGLSGITSFHFNYQSRNGLLYQPIGEVNATGREPEVFAYDLCDGSIIGSMQVHPSDNLTRGYWGFTVTDTDWYVAGRNGRIYRGSLNPSLYTTPNSATGQLLFDTDNDGSRGPGTTSPSLMGIDVDEDGNIYVIINDFNGAQSTVVIRKYSPTGTLLAEEDQTGNSSTFNSTDGQAGFWGARGIVYSESSGLLYVGNFENCVTVFDKDLNELSTLNIGNPVQGDPKGLAIATECCPAAGTSTVNSNLCTGDFTVGDVLFLSDLTECNGPACDGDWVLQGALTDMTYESCNNSITITGNAPCGTFQLSGGGAGQQCAAFNITVEICVSDSISTDTPTSALGTCTGTTPNNDASITIPNIMNADVVGVSTAGASSYNGSTYEASATASDLFLVSAGTVTITGLEHSQTYILRLFNQGSSCFIDVNVTSAQPPTACQPSCSCTEKLYLNDEDVNEVHKFTLDNNTGALTEIGSPWLGNNTIIRPHGLAVDNNGRIYVGQGNTFDSEVVGPIFQMNCDGAVLDNDYVNTPDGKFGYNVGSANGVFYTPDNATNTIKAYSLCTGDLIGEMNIQPNGAFAGGWGFYVNQEENRWYYPDRNALTVYTGSLDTTLYTTTPTVDGTAAFSLTLPTTGVIPMGITKDAVGNYYIVFNTFAGSAATTYIRKYDASGNLLTTISDNTSGNNTSNGQSGFWGARGIAYSEDQNKLYVGSFNNCIAVFDTNLNEQVALNIGNPANTKAKGVSITKECCPTSSSIVIDTVMCSASVNQVFFLQDMINCEGTICEGIWQAGNGNTGMTYFSCDNSVRIDALSACGSFTLQSDGTSSNAQCGAFSISININVSNIDLTVTQNSCTDNNDGTFTANYTAQVDWSSVPCEVGEMINVTNNGTNIGIINPAMDSSPSTFSFSVAANGNGTNLIKAAFTAASCADSTSFKTPLPCPNDVATCASTSGCLGGNVFEDFNCNGTDDTNEPGVQGVEVQIYDCNNALVGTGFSDSEGDWQVCGLTDTEQYRVEFVLPDKISCWATPTHVAGSGNQSDVQFLTAPVCTQFSVSNAVDYCQTNPRLSTTCFESGTSAGKSAPALISSTYSNILNTNSSGKRTDGQIQEIGSAWGLAFQRNTQRLFTAASVKRHAGEGPRGFDGVYVFDYTSNGVPLLGGFDLEGIAPANIGDAVSGGVNISLGTVNRVTSPNSDDNYLPSSSSAPSRDLDAFDKAARVSFGDIDLSEDENTLWLVNLNQRALISVDVSNYTPATATPSAPSGTVNQYLIEQIPNIPNCGTSGTIYPWGLKIYRGKGYLGVICNGENSQDINDVTGYILSFEPNNVSAGFATELTIPMNYNREDWGANNSNSDGWRAWVTNWAQTGLPTSGLGGFSQVAYPQPVISDIEFADNGDMVIGVVDRFSVQMGSMQPIPVSGSNIMTSGVSNGDILHACQDGGTFILEDGGTTCGHPDLRSNANVGASSGTLLTNDGPGNNGEYYFDDYHQNNQFTTHKEIALGALAILRGENQVLATVFDPQDREFFENGYHVYNTNTGVEEANYEVFANGPNTGEFGKQAGLGDVEFICDPAPLEIGNYVWCDSIQNGIQDACERGISNLIVQLYDQNGNLVGQDTTVNGQYYFNQYNVDTTGITVDGNGNATPNTAWSGMSYSTQYFIVFGGGQFGGTEFTVGSEMYGITSMVNVGTNDNIDSDVDGSVLTSGSLGARPNGLPFIDMTTSATGCGDHKYDMGLTCTTPCEIILSYAPASCIDNMDGTFTATYDIIATWSNAPAGEMINIILDGSTTQTINASTLTSPQTIQFNLNADGNGTHMFTGTFATTTTCTDTLIIKAPLPCPNDIATCTSQTGCLGGNTFEDFNCNGVDDTHEPGVQGVRVEVYDCTNALVGTGFSDSEGDWQVCGLTDTEQYRVEFVLPDKISCWAKPTATGSNNNSSIQFMTAPNCGDFGLADPLNYNGIASEIVAFVPCYVNGDPLAGGDSGTRDWFVGFDYGNSGTGTSPQQMVDGTTIGAVWGVAYSLQAQKVFTSAFLKRHVGLGTLGSGGIYLLEPTANSFNVSGFYDLDANGYRTRADGSAPTYGNGTSYQLDGTGNVITYLGTTDPVSGQPSGLGVIGVNGAAGRNLPSSSGTGNNDVAAFDQVGKVSLGDLEISDDGKYLFVLNLYSREVVRLELDNPSNPTAVISVTSYALDDIPSVPTCTNGTLRPGALKYYRGDLYVGATCTNENRDTSIAGNTDLAAYIFKLNNATGAASFSSGAILSQILDFNKGQSRGSQPMTFQNNNWNNWTNDFTSAFGKYPIQKVYPTPWLTDIDFLEGGHMVMAFSDRAGHQYGFNNRDLFNGAGTVYDYQMGGHLLFAENVNGTFVMENGGQTPNFGVSAATRLNGEGPGGGEFYSGAFYTGGDNNPYPPNPFSGNHPSTAMGSVAALVGSNEIIISAMDPATLYSGGTLRLESNTGAKVVGSGYNLYSGSSPTYFGKAAGLGEVELRRINAPLEIGNYVWCDSIPNGIQDACERGISNLIVQLYDQNGNLVGQDTTVNGQYYFNQYNVDTTGITVDGNGNATPNTAWSGMSYSTQYFIVFGGGQFGGTEFTVGSEMYGITSMVNVGTNDNIDSDVDGSSLTSGSLGTRPDGLPFIDMTTSATGCGEHRFDMGVTCTTCTNPTASIFAIQNSCTNGAVDANTAYIQLSAVNNGDRFAISTGSTFTGNTDYSAATAIGSTLDTLLSGLANPTGSQAYTVRVFNGESNCFTDLVVTLKEQDCSVDCDCKDMLYVNDPEIDATHKFSINESTGAMTEIGNHWMDNLVDNPHGPATDINGFLYISDNGNTGDLYQFNCDGQILNNGNPVILQSSEAFNSYNMGSFDGYLYTFQRDENLVKAFNLCDKSFVGSMNVGAIMDNSWGFYVDKKEGRWYLPNRGDDAVYSGLLDISLYTNPATATAQKEFDLQFGAPVGITRDDAGNFYIIEDQTPGGNGKGINDDNVILSKYNAAGNFITSIEELGPASVNATDGQAGWYGGRGLTYSSASGYLYVSARDNCVAVFDTTLTEIPSLNIGNPSNTIAKGVKILKECCPTNNNTTIDTNLCVASLNDQLFLQELVNCSGTICEGLWQVGAGNTGMTYNACDNSVSINALNACGTFILESDGTGNNPQCGAFKITVNISVNVVTASVVAANQTVCAGGDPAAFTVATPATGGTLSYQWQSSTDSLVGYVNIGGATSDTYDPPSGITDTTFYRVIVNSTNAGCSTGNCADTSNVLSISVINCCAEINQLITDRTICTGQTIDSLAATTTFTNPDSIAFVYFTTAQTDSSVIYTSGTGIDTLQILGSSDTVLLTNTIIPAFTATTTPETFYVYAIKYPTPSTATCRPYEEIRVIVNPIDTTEINQAICDGTGYFFNGAIRKDAGMYFDTLTQTNGCDSIIKLTLTLNPKPDLATTDTTICDGVTIDLNNRVTDNANLAGTITFHSTLANANSGSSPLTNSVSPTVTTRFYVRKVTDAHGCPDVDSTLITVQPVPDLATTNQTVCAGISVNLSTLVTDNATGTDGTITYHGSLADAQTGVNNLGSNLTPIATTKYYIRKETTTGSCVDIDSLIITLQPLPNLVTTDLTICAGTSTDLNDRVTDNNNTTGSQTFFLSMADLNAGSNLQSNPVSPTNTTKYYVRKITTTGSCQDVDSLTITVQPLPNLVTRDTTLCAGQSVDLANQTIDTEGITGTTTYHTTLVDAQNGTNMLGSTTVNPASDEKYYVRKITTTASCLAIDSIAVTIQPNPDLATTDSTICNGDMVDIAGLVTDNATGTAGTISYHSSLADAQGNTNPMGSTTVNPSSTTKYYFRKETTSANCVDLDSVTITVQPNPDLTTTDATICAGTGIDLSGQVTDASNTSGTTTFHSTLADAQSGNGSLSNGVTPTSTTKYYVRKVTTTANCVDVDSLTITIEPVPALITVDSTVCANTDIDLASLVADDVTVAGTTTFHNSLMDAQTGSNALGSSTVNSATTTKYYVRKITNTASCIDVDSMTITRQPLPDLVTEDSTICATQAVDLAGLVTDNAGTTGTVTFHTSNTDAQLGMNALGNSNVSPSSNTTYFVRKVTTVGGCYSTASLTIMVQPNPDLSTTDATICNGASIDLSGQVTDNASTTGTMSFHTSLADAQNSANPISPTTVNPSATTKYYVQKTTTTANCQDIDSLTITVQPLPDLMTTNDTICAMESIALTGLVSDNAATVGTISFHNSLTDAQNGANALGSTNVSPVNTTKYFVRKSTTTASCVDVDSLEITVQPLPDLMTNNDTLCAGQSVDIATLVTDNAGTTGTMTYHTSLADAQSGTNPMGSTTVSPANTTTYFVRKITTINNCLDIDSLTVQIEPVPNLTTQDSAICAGTTIDIAPLATDAAGLTGSITFHNNLADAQGGTNPMGSTSVTPASTTKYYVSKAVGTQNCRDIDSLTVTVNPLPANATNPRDTSYCNGGTVPPLRVDDPSAGFTVTWWTAATGGSQVTGATMGGSRNEAITLSGTSSPAAPVVGNTTTIYAEIVNTTTMCVSASRVAVNLTNHEEPSITSITPMGCSGDTTMLAATVVNGALPYGYTWSIVGSAITPFAGGTATSTDAMPEFDASSVAPGTYMIQLALQDANNCVDTSTFNFVVQAGPDATFTTVDNMVCAGDTAVVYAVENQGVGASYSWTFSNASLVRGGTATDTFLVVNWDQGGTSGTVNVTVTLASGCSGQNTTNVTISPKPTLAATSNSPICAGDTLQLNATASGGTPNYNYNWSGPNSFSANVEDPFIANTTLAAAGTYLVTVTDVNGCSDSTNTVVTIEQVPDLTTRDTTVCPDATVDLATLVTDENGTTGTTTFYHNLADAESNTNAIGSTIDTSLTTRYYVRKSITNVPNCTDIDSILVTIQPNPDLVTTNTLICANETVDLSTLVTDNNGTTGTLAYYATLANAQSGTSPISANQILTDTTTFYITKTTATASCTDLDSVTVNVQALPDLATTDSTICAATTIDLVGLVTDNANTAGTMTFHTNLADANSGSSSIASSVTPTVITKYYVRKATTMGMCVAVDSTTITVQTNPDLVTTDTTICAGQSTDLTTRVVDNAGTVGTVSFYQSRTDAVANTGALGSPSVTPNFSTQYFVRKATTTADCVELDSFMVMIQPLPDLVATTALICAGQSVNLATLVTDNASTTGTISYHNTLSDAQTNVNPIANTQSPTANATYYAAKRTTNANCLDVVEITVNVQALPDLATTDSTICAGIAVDLNGLVTDNASTTGTVSFHTTHADATNGTGGIASSVSPTSTTDYYVRKITTGSNCVDTDSLTITVQPNPDLVTTDSLICAGTTIDLSGLVTDNAGTTGTLSYHTTVADAQANTSPIGSSVTPTATRRYYFRKATTTGNCTAIDSTLITVQMLPNLVTQPDTICAGTGIDLTTLVTDNAGTTGTLSFHNSLVDAQANANPITNNQTPISNQKYYVLKTTTMGNCTDVDSIEIVVQPLPNLGARDTTICEGESVDISVLVTDTANTTGATTFHSNLADANSGTNSLATTVNPAITTRYYVRKVTTTKGCPDVDSLTVNVTTLPDLATRDTSICTNESVDLALLFTDNANTVGTTTYYNSLADANIATNAIGSSVTPTSTDTFYLRKAVSSSSCFAVDSIVVTLLPLPDLSTTPTTICPSESVDLSTLVAHNAGTAGTTTYHNSLADALSNSNNIGPNQNPSTTTKYYIRKSTTNNCLDYDSVMVNVQPLPDLVTTPGAVCPGGNVDLTTLVTDNTGAAGTLTAHANLADAQNGTSVIANTVSPTTQTTYYLRKVTTTASCVAVDSVTVSILPEANIQGRDTSICAGMSLDLKRLLSGTVSGSLKYGTSFGNYPDTISTLITAAATQTYFIENEIGGGCTDTTMIRVTTLACDLGDLPDTSATFNASDYQTLLANNGPIHVIIPGLSLGVTVDGETDGQPSNDALGDGDDEDGLTIFPSLDLKPGVPFKLPLSVSNTTGDTAYVEAWIDWNGDGDFDDPNEMVANFKDATDGNFPNSINGTVPTNATTGRLLGVRIRVSNTDNMTPYGYQNSGEIEDYLIGIDCPSIICVPVSYEINRE